jgi:glucose-1-phosphatase
MSIDLVLFDLDDVLVEYSHEVRCRTLAERIGSDPETIHQALFSSGLETQADLGRIDAGMQAQTLSDALGIPVSVADCVAARAASMTPDPVLVDIVDALSRRCALAILTNNGLLVRDHFPVLCPAFARYFDGRVHCSAMYGLSKPDPDIFLRCAASLEVMPERVLFIDDKLWNAEGAERAGMHGHHYRDHSSLRLALSTHDLLENAAHASRSAT